MHSVLCMVFNHSRDELITGGTGGMKVTDKAYMYISVAKQSRRKKSVFIKVYMLVKFSDLEGPKGFQVITCTLPATL